MDSSFHISKCKIQKRTSMNGIITICKIKNGPKQQKQSKFEEVKEDNEEFQTQKRKQLTLKRPRNAEVNSREAPGGKIEQTNNMFFIGFFFHTQI